MTVYEKKNDKSRYGDLTSNIDKKGKKKRWKDKKFKKKVKVSFL